MYGQPYNDIGLHGQPTILLVQTLPEKLDLRPRDKLLDMKEMVALVRRTPLLEHPDKLTHAVDSTAS